MFGLPSVFGSSGRKAGAAFRRPLFQFDFASLGFWILAVKYSLRTGGQARQSLKNIQALLAEVGATEKNVVKTTVFLTSMADFKEVNEAYAAVFDTDCPARSCVAVKELPLNGLVEIEAIVVL